MGFQTEFCYILKPKTGENLKAVKDLRKGGEYEFEKDEYRIYPLDMPIDLLDEDWKAIARINITKVVLEKGETRGKYKVLKIYKGEEKKIITQYWREFNNKYQK